MAQRVVEIEAERIALAIAAIVPVVDPELVVLGGGIGSNGDLLLEPVERELASDLAVPSADRGIGASARRPASTARWRRRCRSAQERCSLARGPAEVTAERR